MSERSIRVFATLDEWLFDRGRSPEDVMYDEADGTQYIADEAGVPEKLPERFQLIQK